MSKIALQIEFANEKAARHFATWLCESGEQDYWEYMRIREERELGPITALQFDYHTKSDGNVGEFVEDFIIHTECGRLSEEGVA